MPRTEREIDPAESPVVEFAFQLRRVRSKAGVTYRVMAEDTHFSHAHLVRAARGDKLPSWPVTKAYLRGCRVTSEEALEAWEQYWAATEAVAARPTGKRRRRGLNGIATMAEFGEHLQDLSNRNGRRTLRQLQELTMIGKSTINDWFQGRRLPSPALLHRFTLAVGATPKELEQLLAARLRLARGGAYGSELASALAAVLRTDEDNPMSRAAREVSVALVKAEGRRIGRTMMLQAHEESHHPIAPDTIDDERGGVRSRAEGRRTPGSLRSTESRTRFASLLSEHSRTSRVAYELERLNAAHLVQSIEPRHVEPRHQAEYQAMLAAIEMQYLVRIADMQRDTAKMREWFTSRSESDVAAVTDADEEDESTD